MSADGMWFPVRARGRVLDVGCGPSPHLQATVLADLYENYEWQGRSHPIPTGGRPFVRCDVQQLPFRDRAFDFVICSHVLEHVRDPAAACRELVRVGMRGYIECPRSWVEYAFSSEDHRWLVDYEARVLIFREKLDEERRDFVGVRYKIFEWLNSPWFLLYWNQTDVRRLRTVELHWQKPFAVAVITKENRGQGRPTRRTRSTHRAGPRPPAPS